MLLVGDLAVTRRTESRLERIAEVILVYKRYDTSRMDIHVNGWRGRCMVF